MKLNVSLRLIVLAAILQIADVSGQTNYPSSRGNTRPDTDVTFSNGVRLSLRSDHVIITDGGRRYVMSVKDAKPPPAEMKLTSCGVAKHYLDTQKRVTDRWRAVSLWWADHCL